MSWVFEDTIERRPVGRQLTSPFIGRECEDDFLRRSAKMVELLFEQETQEFVFAEKKRMKKSMFWALVYVHLKELKHIRQSNIQGYAHIIHKHYDKNIATDRAAIAKNVKMLEEQYVAREYIDPTDKHSEYMKIKHRNMYLAVAQKWDSLYPMLVIEVENDEVKEDDDWL